ncbi:MULTISPECIES: DUF418 domain-containing protein [Microbacterium]|uniref:DUF418 domain-containing protein n=1 Tax=Microbacterium wangchenii TaxID=2541726 RepID=A0ABX5SVC0_9MICO|nr:MULTISPECIES: DUF418 domain-containing protein [Microbacterium]MCK6065343.1 DUF418 domain-containing protein [Microbacterium sp. EYE_512]QBR88789.1 DUF418 domain-containing protein [Microbacterium wangchenii]TXK20513.1 DUF418 domain-containing protein [Microbacterium wangchenii]
MSDATVLPAPRSSRPRIDSLDVVRGVAIIGTLGTNIWVFSHPWGLVGLLAAPVPPGTSAAEGVAQLALMALSQGKFLALLSLAFGMGVFIQHDAAQRAGRQWPGRYLWRAALLFLDGVVNYILIAEFDVLMGYAVTGAIVAWLLMTRPRTQRVMIAVFGALHLVLITGIVMLVALNPSSGSPPPGPSPYATDSFLGLAAFRLDNIVLFRAEPVLIGFLTLAMFLIGAALLRARIFAAEGAGLRRRLMIAGAVAFPVDVALGVAGGQAGLLAERYVVAPLVALGVLALIAEVCLRRGTEGWAARRAREVGRVALSAYMLQNLLGGALFYGWGLGLAETAAEWRIPVTVAGFLAITAVVVLSAHLWLRRFALGPVEWLWKRAANIGSRPARDTVTPARGR